MPSKQPDLSIYTRPAEILQRLIRYNTTNPPGDEAECIAYIRGLLTEAGIESTVLERRTRRPNLIARIQGAGKAPPLLLYGHVDVVTTEHQKWEHPPFEGQLINGFIWGRGALDMKGGVAMMLSAFLRANAEGLQPPGDIILAVVTDEEAGGDHGAKFLVEDHADLFKDVRYAIGEFGGFSLTVGKQRFYPIMVAEKQICWMKATVRGRGGPGSIPVRDGAMEKLSRLLHQIDQYDMPVHITPPARMMFDAMAAELSGTQKLILGQLTNPRLANSVVKLMGESGRTFYPLIHNTVSPTILHGSTKVNVIPSEISVELDGRLLPGFSPDDMLKELRPIIGNDVELEGFPGCLEFSVCPLLERSVDGTPAGPEASENTCPLAQAITRDPRRQAWDQVVPGKLRAERGPVLVRSRARLFHPSFKIAPLDVALRFAFDAHPRLCFEQNGRQLPFGAHAWTRWDRVFWQPYLINRPGNENQ